jgi:hypothetical protein
VVRLASLVANDVAPIGVGLTEREFLDGLAVLRCGEFTVQRIRDREDATRIRRLGLLLVECAATHIHSRGANSERLVFEVDVSPPLAGDLSTAQAGGGEVPGMPIAVVSDAA